MYSSYRRCRIPTHKHTHYLLLGDPVHGPLCSFLVIALALYFKGGFLFHLRGGGICASCTSNISTIGCCSVVTTLLPLLFFCRQSLHPVLLSLCGQLLVCQTRCFFFALRMGSSGCLLGFLLGRRRQQFCLLFCHTCSVGRFFSRPSLCLCWLLCFHGSCFQPLLGKPLLCKLLLSQQARFFCFQGSLGCHLSVFQGFQICRLFFARSLLCLFGCLLLCFLDLYSLLFLQLLATFVGLFPFRRRQAHRCSAPIPVSRPVGCLRRFARVANFRDAGVLSWRHEPFGFVYTRAVRGGARLHKR